MASQKSCNYATIVLTLCPFESYIMHMKATRFSPACAFTLVEVLAVMAALAAITAMGYVAVSNSRTSADYNKLNSDVASINRSIQIFQSGGGSLAEAAKSAPWGEGGNGTAAWPERAKASNKMGAALARPTSPGTGEPSGRPTHTPMVMRPSKPTAQASRKP